MPSTPLWPVVWICCKRFHTEVFFSWVDLLSFSWSSIFSNTPSSFTSTSTAAKGGSERSLGARHQCITREGKDQMDKSKQTQRISWGVSLHFSLMPQCFIECQYSLAISAQKLPQSQTRLNRQMAWETGNNFNW